MAIGENKIKLFHENGVHFSHNFKDIHNSITKNKDIIWGKWQQQVDEDIIIALCQFVLDHVEEWTKDKLMIDLDELDKAMKAND